MKPRDCQSPRATPPPPPAKRPVRRGLAVSTGIIALATAASRILGFVRDLLIAQLFGTGLQAQAFVVAFRLPNLLRDFVAEGAVTSAVVPVLSAYRSTKPPAEYWRLAQALGLRMGLLALLLGAAGVAGAPWLVRAIAPGFAGDPEKFALTVHLTRWLFPLISLVGLWAYFMGLLNSLRHFAMPALGPAVLNLGMIAGCVWLVPRSSPGVMGLVAGVLIGGFAQLAIQLPAAWKAGFRWRWVWHHEGSREIVRLLGPRVVGSTVYQIDIFFNTILASLSGLAGEGAVAALYFANRLVQLPLALFGVASAQASLPVLSEHAATNELAAFCATLSTVLRMVAFVTVPASVGLIVLAEPIVKVCFEHGAFSARSTAMTAHTLRAFGVGLTAFAAARVLSGAFYALRDTRTPVRLAAEALAVNIALACVFITPLQVGGLALAASLSTAVNAWRLFHRLERRLALPLREGLAAALGRMAVASALMGLACAVGWPLAARASSQLVALPLTIAGGMLVYGASCHLLHVDELTRIRTWLTKRLPARAS